MSVRAQGKLQRYWGQDPRLEFIESSKVLPYRSEPLYDLAHYHAAMSATAGCPPSPLLGATPLNDSCALIHSAAAFHYARRAAGLPLPSAVRHPHFTHPQDSRTLICCLCRGRNVGGSKPPAAASSAQCHMCMTHRSPYGGDCAPSCSQSAALFVALAKRAARCRIL